MPDVAPVLIDGAWVSARARISRDIRNPATLDLLGVTHDCGPDDVAAAVEAAARAQPAWWRVPGVEKAGLLRTVAAKIRADERELSTLMARETGKPLIEAVDCIEWVAACFDYYAEVGRRSYGTSIPPVAAHQINFTIKEPFGVVAAIVPFNFPAMVPFWFIPYALASGNTFVVKPSELVPLTMQRLAELLERSGLHRSRLGRGCLQERRIQLRGRNQAAYLLRLLRNTCGTDSLRSTAGHLPLRQLHLRRTSRRRWSLRK